MRTLILAALLVSTCVSAEEPVIYIPAGFVSGNMYERFSPDEKRAYVTGMIDGFLYSPALSTLAKEAVYTATHLKRCIKEANMSDSQILAIVEHYLSEHPAEWGGSMHQVVFFAMLDACKSNGIRILPSSGKP